jgi:hypothetical protein
MLLDHEINVLVERVAIKLAARLVRPIRAIIKLELQPMTDAVADLTAATDAALAEIAALVSEVQKDVAALAAIPADNTAAIQTQVKRLQDGTAAAASAVAALQAPAPAPAPADAPSEAPAPAAAPGDGTAS